MLLSPVFNVFSLIFDETNGTVSWPAEAVVDVSTMKPIWGKDEIGSFKWSEFLYQWILVVKLSEILQTNETLTTTESPSSGSLKLQYCNGS